ncbi:UNVERIFIED_CONTAM: hypothetical protein GTU68_063846 [Idotea baltica]|nr:hypothetical protein [Idotea baltica]
MTALSIMQLLPHGSKFSGRIRFDGLQVDSIDEEQMCAIRGNDIGMVFQEPMTALNPVQNIGTQVAECIALHKSVSRAQSFKQAAQVLEKVGLPNAQFPLTRYPHELSGGQRQRVVIAIAVALEPKLLIADEPTTALDVTTQEEILQLLKQLIDESDMAMILITHDLAVVSEVADKIVIMRSGEVLDSGPTKTIFKELKHPYTRALYEASSHSPERGAKVDETLALVEVNNLICEYPKARKTLFGARDMFRAVNDVSFSIYAGESVGLVGESGCGKSTLAKALLGLSPIQGGQVLLRGEQLHTGVALSRQVRREMQVVFQDPYSSFNPRHRVGRLIAEPLHVLDNQPSRAERKELIEATLISVGMSGNDADKYIHEFSGGQRQRIAIARALIIRPALIVLDEAVSALDVSVRAQVLDLLAELADTHSLAYLFISHDLSVVRSITDRVLVMKDSKIVERGNTEQVFVAPENSYTKKLLAAAPQLPTSSA